ncbi:MAG: HAD-IC family P-type ATPase, partial [Oscillospiraceae bacterium]
SSIAVSGVVLDDILHLASGNQICADCILAQGEVEVNESLLTGESDPVTKKAGDTLLSGSFIVSGDCLARVEHVGLANYANQIAGDAKYLKKPNSQIVRSLNMIVKIIGFSIIPVGIALFTKQFFVSGDTLQSSVVSTVAALIGMIPEGLVLLTSVVFAVSVIRLSRHKTLVQELYCIETLARVDVLCLDKTGTITEGTMQTDDFVPFAEHTQEE